MTAAPAAAVGTYARLASLPLRIESCELSPLDLVLGPHFTRHTTVVHLRGARHVGAGEDTTYRPPDQLAFRAAGPPAGLEGDWTLGAFSDHVGALDLFPAEPGSEAFRSFRRWAFESAALDLALRQAERSLADLLGRTPRSVRFVVSPGHEGPREVAARLALYPGLRLKLMPDAGWDDATVARLAGTGAVDVVDLKGCYPEDVPVAVRPDAQLYRRVLEAFPDAWIEDPGTTPETEGLLAEHRDRITWDAPIRSVEDIMGLAHRPRMINVKPSRLGSVPALLDVYDHCSRAGIGMYGGGQFELGPGRRQIQLLAALFHPNAPNDVAPASFNEPGLRPGLPTSPLPAPEVRPGF